MKHKERGNTHMAKEQLIFCGSSRDLSRQSAHRRQQCGQRRQRLSYSSLVNADGTLIAAIDRALRSGLGLH